MDDDSLRNIDGKLGSAHRMENTIAGAPTSA